MVELHLLGKFLPMAVLGGVGRDSVSVVMGIWQIHEIDWVQSSIGIDTAIGVIPRDEHMKDQQQCTYQEVSV